MSGGCALAAEVMTIAQIGDQAGLDRLPAEPLPGQRRRSRHVRAGEVRERAELTRRNLLSTSRREVGADAMPETGATGGSAQAAVDGVLTSEHVAECALDGIGTEQARLTGQE